MRAALADNRVLDIDLAVAQRNARRRDVSDELNLAGAPGNALAGSRLAFIGAGVMAESMIAGSSRRVDSGGARIASHPRQDRRQRLEERFGILTRKATGRPLHGADLVVLTIKPQVLQSGDAPVPGSLDRVR